MQSSGTGEMQDHNNMAAEEVVETGKPDLEIKTFMIYRRKKKYAAKREGSSEKKGSGDKSNAATQEPPKETIVALPQERTSCSD